MNKNTSEKKTSADRVNDALVVTSVAIALVGTAFIIQDFGKAVARKCKSIKNRDK